MRRLPVLGTLSIIASLPPMAMAVTFLVEAGASPASLPFLFYAIPGAATLVAGFLLLVGRRQAYAWGVVSWSLMIIVAAFNLTMSWWPSEAGDLAMLLYVTVGIAVVVFLMQRRRADKAATNGDAVAP